MSRFLVRRFFTALFALFASTMLVFGMSRLTGDPREQFLTVETTQENWDAWGEKYGLNRPFLCC